MAKSTVPGGTFRTAHSGGIVTEIGAQAGAGPAANEKMMKYSAGTRCRASLSLPIIRASRSQHRSGTLTVGSLLSVLGEASFGWALVVLSLVNLLPLPPGFTLLTAIPLLVTSAQMCLGYSSIRLPRRFADLRLDHVKLRRTVLRLRPLTRRLERLLQKRHRYIFNTKNVRAFGGILFAISFALFLPLPLSGWFPAISLFVVGVGVVEEDGLVAMAGLFFGVLSIGVTGAMLFWIASGAEAALN